MHLAVRETLGKLRELFSTVTNLDHCAVFRQLVKIEAQTSRGKFETAHDNVVSDSYDERHRTLNETLAMQGNLHHMPTFRLGRQALSSLRACQDYRIIVDLRWSVSVLFVSHSHLHH